MQQQRDTNPLVGRDRDLPYRASFLKKVVEIEPVRGMGEDKKTSKTLYINYRLYFERITLAKNTLFLRKIFVPWKWNLLREYLGCNAVTDQTLDKYMVFFQEFSAFSYISLGN